MWQFENETVPHIQTELPGPKAQALLERDQRYMSPSYTRVYPLVCARGSGAVIEDVDGNRYLDFAGGIGCLNIGHQAPRVLSAIREQLEKHLHLCFAVTPYESYIALAEKLNALAPGMVATPGTQEHSQEEAFDRVMGQAKLKVTQGGDGPYLACAKAQCQGQAERLVRVLAALL